MLGQVTNNAFHLHGLLHDVEAVDAHIARGGRDEAGDDFHQGGLARTIGAEKADNTFINREGDVVEGELFTVLFGDILDFDGHFFFI